MENSDKPKQPICHRPWTGFELYDHLGDVRPCCWGKVSCGNVNKASATEIWNGPGYEVYREKMSSGQIDDICKPECPILLGLYEERLPRPISDSSPLPGAQNRIAARSPQYLRVVPSIACNLRCPMCYQLEDPPVNLPADLFQQLEPWIDQAYEFLILGGEPFIAKRCLHWIEQLRPELYPKLGLAAITNGLGFSPETCELISNRRWHWILVSIDAATPEVYSVVRGGDFTALREGLERLTLLRAIHPHPFEIRFGFTIQNSNISDTIAFLSLCEEFGALPQFTMVCGDWHDEMAKTEEQKQNLVTMLERLDKELKARGFSHRVLAPALSRAKRQQVIFDVINASAPVRLESLRASSAPETSRDSSYYVATTAVNSVLASPERIVLALPDNCSVDGCRESLAHFSRKIQSASPEREIVLRVNLPLLNYWQNVATLLRTLPSKVFYLHIPYWADGEADTVLRWHRFVEEIKAELTDGGHQIKGGLIDPTSLGIRESALSPPQDTVYQRQHHESISVSVVSPIYNRERELPEFLSSMAGQKASNPWELILVDDGSEDSSVACALNHFKKSHWDTDITIIRLQRDAPFSPGTFTFRAGLARQVGVNCSRGKQLLFLDPDQVVDPHCIEMHEFYSQHMAPIIVGHRVEDSDVAYERVWRRLESEVLAEQSNWWLYFCTGNSSVQRDLFDSVGGFDVALQYWGLDDTDLGYRLFISNSRVWHTPRAIVRHLATKQSGGGWTREERIRSCRVHMEMLYRKHLDGKIITAFDFAQTAP